MPSILENQLLSFYTEILSCSYCGLPRGYSPQIRPTGRNYRKNGIVFAQTNPGHIERLKKSQIEERYKTQNSRKWAALKAHTTQDLIEAQDTFINKPTKRNWQQLNNEYHYSMKRIWGWPPGKYCETIEKHGVSFDDVAMLNIAQCPIPDDKYTNNYLSSCWSNWTSKLLEILQPKYIVAQGKTAFKWIEKQTLPDNSILLEGIHHASRQKREVKEKTFKQVLRILP